MDIKSLPIGAFFTLKPIENPKESQVWIRGEYDRSEKKYVCTRFDDFCNCRLIAGNKVVFTDFCF